MILSLDIGGSKIAAGLVNPPSLPPPLKLRRTRKLWRARTKIFYFQKIEWQKPLTTQKIVDQIIQIILDYRLKILDFSAITIGIAGQVNQKGEVFITRHLLAKETKIALKKILEIKFKLPVYVENDANCFALGEAVFGQAKNKKTVVGITLGSGIGGGIVINKKIYRGQHGYASEFGHMIIEPNGAKCSCDKKGCWEAYASAWGIKNFYQKITKKRKNSFEIAKEFKEKKKAAVLAVERVAQWLAIGLANIINILDPETIVLGGGLARFQGLITLALKEVKKWLVVSNVRTKILVSQQPEKMTLLGASLLAY